MPFWAWATRFFPSKEKGRVTMPTVSTPMSRAMRATTGAPPVPVPPPMPAVMKTISVLASSRSRISSMDSSVAACPISGWLPAPRPLVSSGPSCTRLGTGLLSRAWASVLQITKLTSLMPCRNMWLTALQPPPPMPKTLMMEERSWGRSNSMSMGFCGGCRGLGSWGLAFGRRPWAQCSVNSSASVSSIHQLRERSQKSRSRPPMRFPPGRNPTPAGSAVRPEACSSKPRSTRPMPVAYMG